LVFLEIYFQFGKYIQNDFQRGYDNEKKPLTEKNIFIFSKDEDLNAMV
jgi:hypothetical protein